MRLSVPPFAALALLTLAAAPLCAQQQESKKPDSTMKAMKHDMKDAKGMHDMGGHAMSPWKEMDAFHAVLAVTYHPAADKRDLAPLKAKAGDLASTARTWAGSTPPKACDNAETKSVVAALADSAASLAEQVKGNATDGALTTAITAIHARFETVEMGCAAKGAMPGMKH